MFSFSNSTDLADQSRLHNKSKQQHIMFTDEDDVKNTFVEDKMCAQKGCRATWGFGNQLFIYAGGQVPESDEKGSLDNTEAIIHEVRWNTDLYNSSIRKLISESHGIFLKIQKYDTESGSSKSKQQMVKFSREYRSVIKACLIDLQKTLRVCPSDSKKSEQEVQLQLLDMAELVWSLCEILFIDTQPGGMVISQLLEWLRWHFVEADKMARDALQSEKPQNHSNYWDCVYSFLLQGRVEDAQRMLSVHSLSNTEAYQSIRELLHKMPLYSNSRASGQTLGEFEMKWRHWQEESRRRLESGEFVTDNHLETICKLLCGDEQVFIALKDLCENWYCMLVSKLLYQNPSIKALDLQYHTQFCINAYGGNAQLQAWDNTLLAALEFDVHQVIKECSTNCGNWWFVTHLTDLLHHSSVLESQTLYYGSNLREFLMLEYASSLMSHSSLWQTGVDYFDFCPQFGREYIQQYIERLPLETEKKAHKVIRICEQRDMHDQVKSICKMMGMQALHNHRLGAALSWGLRSKDVSFVTVLAEKFLLEYTESGDFSNLDLIDNLGSSMLLSSKLTFLGKYREFHKMYGDGDFKAAASLLLSLLTARLAPKKFWLTLLTDALPLLEADDVIFSSQQTYELLHCLEELYQSKRLKENNLKEADQKMNSQNVQQSEEVEKEKLDLMKLALARNLARAILQEGKTTPF